MTYKIRHYVVNTKMALHVIMGSMFSGKSTELIRRVKRLKSIGMHVLLVNHAHDTRTGKCIETHDNVRVTAMKTNDLLMMDIQSFDAIAIDEAQFFNNLRPAVMLMVETHNKYVIVAGLNGDYKRRRFGQLLDLIPVADTVTMTRALCAVCSDGTPASFTKRTTEEEDTICVGGADKYIPVCRKHY